MMLIPPHARDRSDRLGSPPWAWVRRVVWAVGVAWLGLAPTASARGAADDEAGVRARIDAYWRGFDSIQVESTENSDAAVDGRDSRCEVRFAWVVDGRSALFETRVLPGSTIRSDVRQDRQKAFRVTYFDTPTPAIDRITIQPPWNAPGEYRGGLSPSLRVFLPGGKTLARLLADGATLRTNGRLAAHRWSLAAEVRGTRIDCALDEQHDYLPVALMFAGEGFEVRVDVDQFDRQGDFWFPKRGHGTSTTTLHGGPVSTSDEFTVDQVRFNEAIPATRFEMPALSAGVEVFDSTTKTRRIEGGKLARDRLKKQFPPPRRPKPNGPTIQVPPTIDQRGTWLSPALIALGVVSGLSVIGLKWRRRG